MKVMLVGFLALLMAGVWGRALLGTASPAPAVTTRRAPLATGRPAAVSEAAASTNAGENKPQASAADWPLISLQRAVLNDPFAKPEWSIVRELAADQPAAQNRQQMTAAEANRQRLSGQRTSMVVISEDKKYAAIGDRIVRVGDYLEGFEVIDITRAGVILAEQQGANTAGN